MVNPLDRLELDSMTYNYLAELTNDPKEALEYLLQAAQQANKEDERKRVAKLVDFYVGEQVDHMKGYIEENYPMTHETVLPSLEISNVTRAIVDRLSVIYNEAPKREIYIGEPDNPSEPDQILFDKIAKMGLLNTKADVLNRLETLTGTVHMRFWIDKDGDVHFDPLDRTMIQAVPNPQIPTKADAILHFATHKDKDDKDYKLISYWDTETHMRFIKRDGKIEFLTDPNNPDNINPFGVIPFVRLSTSIIEYEYWGAVNEDLISTQEMINDTLTGLNNCIKFQSFSVPLFIGFDESPSAKDVGAGVPVAIPAMDKNTHPPDFRFETPSPMITEVSDEITEKMVRFARSRGLPENTFSVSSGDVSGYSLYIQQESLREHFNRQKAFYVAMEERLFEVVKAVWNYNADALPDGHPLRGMKFSDNAQMNCTITAGTTKKTPEQITTEWTFLLENGIKTPIDYLIEVEGMSQAEAEKRIEEARIFQGANPLTQPQSTIIQQT